MLCVPSARHLFGTASLASSALSASAELLVFNFNCSVAQQFFYSFVSPKYYSYDDDDDMLLVGPVIVQSCRSHAFSFFYSVH